MDIAVSRKEKRFQPNGAVMELVDNIFDFYLEFNHPYDDKVITNIKFITDPKEELIDRAMFSIVKQKGLDPVDIEDGIEWAQYLLGEVPAPLILTQIQKSVQKEGAGVRVTPVSSKMGTDFTVGLV